MPTRTVAVTAPEGLHARPAALLAAAVNASGLEVGVALGGAAPVDAGSILELMSLGARRGDVVTLSADGAAADAVLDRLVALDGGTGQVIVSPTGADVAGTARRRRRREAALAGTGGPGATLDGWPVALLANVGTADDAARAAACDLEGAGLFRTEFLFLDRVTAPTAGEQAAAYAAVLRAFGERPVVVRTLDAGADKPLPFTRLGAEESPALGRRGLRLSQAREDLLDAQLAALAEAARSTAADVRVMAPMVATVEEAEWFAARARAAGLPRVGVMIETPAAALRAGHLLGVVDFASVGTNDLAQYAMAADRTQAELAGLLSPWQPAVLQLVAAACEAGRATGRPVGICGEAAGDPALALVLVGLGASSLSMAPSRVGAVRAALRSHDLATCRRMADGALAARTAGRARDAVLAAARPALLDLL